METIFGIDSIHPVNLILKNGYTLYDWIMREKGFPDFCMRTLCGENAITLEEIQFLRSKNNKIGLVIRNLDETTISKVNGSIDAINAINSAKDLDIPQYNGIAIFAKISNDFSINHNWIISFAKTIISNGYVPGFIGNTDSSKNFCFNRQYSHFILATKKVQHYSAILMGTEPKCNTSPNKWLPFCPSVLNRNDVKLWATGETKFDNYITEDVYAQNKEVLDIMW